MIDDSNADLLPLTPVKENEIRLKAKPTQEIRNLLPQIVQQKIQLNSLSNGRTGKETTGPICIQNFRTSLEKYVSKYHELEEHEQKVASQSPQLLGSRDIDCKKYRQTDKLTACTQRGIVFRVIFVFGLCFVDDRLRFGIVLAN